MRQQYRGYAVCGRCGLLAELSVSVAPIAAGAPAAPPAPDRAAAARSASVDGECVETEPGRVEANGVAEKRMSGRRAAAVSFERDEEWEEWIRRDADGERVLVADDRDTTPVQGLTEARCTLCRQQSAHSQAYHAVQLEKERRGGNDSEGTV